MPRRDVRGHCACGVAMHVTSSEGTATTHSIELQFFLIAAVLRPVHSELLGIRGYLFLPASRRRPKAIQSPGSPAPTAATAEAARLPLRGPHVPHPRGGVLTTRPSLQQPRPSPWARERRPLVCFPRLLLRGLKTVRPFPKRQPKQGVFVGSEAPSGLRLCEQLPPTWVGRDPSLAAGRGADTRPSPGEPSSWHMGPRALERRCLRPERSHWSRL